MPVVKGMQKIVRGDRAVGRKTASVLVKNHHIDVSNGK